MEQVLAVYERPYDEQFPVVCVDESPKQLIEITQYRSTDGTRIEDSEYIRHGVGEIYMAFEPLAGLRFVEVKDDGTGHPAQGHYVGGRSCQFIGWCLCQVHENDGSWRQFDRAAGAVPTNQVLFTRSLGPNKPKHTWTGWSLCTALNMVRGWTWLRSNFLFCNVIV